MIKDRFPVCRTVSEAKTNHLKRVIGRPTLRTLKKGKTCIPVEACEWIEMLIKDRKLYPSTNRAIVIHGNRIDILLIVEIEKIIIIIIIPTRLKSG